MSDEQRDRADETEDVEGHAFDKNDKLDQMDEADVEGHVFDKADHLDHLDEKKD